MTRFRPSSTAGVLAAGSLGLLGVYLVVALVLELAAPNSVDGHHDFFAFYSAATLLGNHRPDAMYDAGAMTSVERGIFNHAVGYAGYMPYLNPPFAAVFHLPFAGMAEPVARVLWTVIDGLVAAVCAVLATAGLPRRIRWLVGVAFALSFPVYQALVEDQWSFVLLLGCLGSIALFRTGRPVLAGVPLALLALKPPLLVLVILGLLIARHAPTVLAACGTAVALVLVTAPVTGLSVYATYARYLVDVSVSHVSGAGATGTTTWEGGVAGMQGLNGLAASIVGQDHPLLTDVLAAGAAAAILVALASRLLPRAGRSLGRRDVLLLAATGLLLDPHLYAQDCVLLLVLVPLLFPQLESRAQMWGALALVALMDLPAIDTSWVPHPLPWGPHLLTWLLVAAVIVGARHAWHRPGRQRISGDR